MGSLPVTVGINGFLSPLGGEGRQSRPWVSRHKQPLSVIEVVQGVSVSIAALTGSGVALYGVNAWQKQMRGKTE